MPVLSTLLLNPSFMIDVCARSCNTCHLRNLTTRCGHLLDMPESVEPGAINRTVQRMLNIRGLSVEILSEDPWILKFPKFLTEEEIAFLTDAKTRGPWNTGQTEEYGRRKEVYTGFRKTDVAWCNCPCQDHPVGRMLVSRVSEVLQVHPHYLEKMQFLRYTPGMFFKPHHDAYLVGSPNDPRNTRKHRVYTFFMYLTDVARGGATHFPSLGLKVQPERGAAILWPSVYDHDPWKADPRTEHEGLAVEEGEKLSLNMWWRLGPNALAQDVGCPDWR
ncbi:unnamed protein product [Prorocentrum cordatum]|uniref:Fe2OG dioxygenase domain-containing protein n=1 Tax=Prorocentrum cordatum TaxID=2364126 RepID=A0ABN9RHT6_9DINO|nr:unnamed protein product [Polarella glacialis]